MSHNNRHLAPGYLSLAVSMLALVVALSGTAYAALAKGEVKAKNIANGAVRTAKLKDGAVTAPKVAAGAVGGASVADGSLSAADLADGSVGAGELADGSVDTGAVVDRSLRLHDLGGGRLNQETTTSQALAIAAGECRQVSLRLDNPAVAGSLGSLVVGTITTAAGTPVVNNTGFVVPTLLTGTSQGGAIYSLGVCAGASAQTVPAGSIVRWSVIAP